MADKPIGDLTPATAFTQSDLLVMEQNGQAKSVTGQVLMRDLAKMLDGHGGIKNIEKVSSVGYVDTYEITTDDGTVFDFTVTNGKDTAPKNWLDNSNFGDIVNQRGLRRYVGTENNGCVDRWNLVSSSTMLVQGTHVICTGTFYQEFSASVKDALNGKTVTVAIRDDEGNLYVASGNFTTGFRAENRGVSIAIDYNKLEITTPEYGMNDPQIALYIGNYTEEDVPEYQPKGYAAELAECRRYYINPDYIDANISWIPEGLDATCETSGTVDKMTLALGIPRPPMDKPPLILHGNASNTYTEEYLSESVYGDEALRAILSGRQILVRTPNSSGDDYVASYSPIYFYQLPNRDNNYLYLFYLRDEKQDLSALLGQPAGTVVMPIYGQLKMLLSETYNGSPLE